ncbi:MAG: acetyl-CoA hydrolase/transferase family protein [Oscillospiraceae bacterium]
MELQAQYRSKLGTVEDELRMIRDGDIICGGTELCEPAGFYGNFHKVAARLRDVEIIKGRRGSGFMYPFMEMAELKGHVNMVCHFYDGALRQCHELGTASHLPSNLHDILKRRTEYQPVINKFIAVATPMDEEGYFSLSGSGMWEEEALRCAETVILEVNSNQPKFPGALRVPLERVDMIVEVDEPTRLYDVRSTPSETDLRIGAYVAEFVHDGDCIQLGLGGMPDAVGNAFFDKKDLGLHTEMFTPVMGDLIAAGVITGARKNIDTGLHIGNFTLGDQKLYDILASDPQVRFRQASYTNDPFVISQIDNMVSINTAMEIDLTGQICSESIGPRQYSGTGGAFDFAYGAQHSRGGRGIIAISSTTKGGTMSKIKATLTPGAVVSIPRNVADIIVTEYGVAYMRGRTVRERAEQLIAIAHPDFRSDLRAEARKLGYIL